MLLTIEQGIAPIKKAFFSCRLDVSGIQLPLLADTVSYLLIL